MPFDHDAKVSGDPARFADFLVACRARQWVARSLRMPGMTTLPIVRDTAPDLWANEFEVGYIAGDGAAPGAGFGRAGGTA